MVIKIPFCFLPNTRYQDVNPETCNLTGFQLQQVKKISKQPEFAYFVTAGEDCVIKLPDAFRPVTILWYSKDGLLHLDHIGQKRILSSITTSDHVEPVTLSHLVYQVRTQ